MSEPRRELQVVPLDEFAAEHEVGGDPLVGDGEDALICQDGDGVVYGDGGAGKTTLVIDLALHLAAGDPWLGTNVPRAVRVLVIENEGPRPLFRRKIARKLTGWTGSSLDGRIGVLADPWSEFTFADESWRAALAAKIREDKIDVLIAGPVTRLGMDEAGTLQQVREFMELVKEVRVASGRRLAVILVHHENKGGTVSGAWEGAGDTLLHVDARGPGKTHLHVQKARWSSEHHGAHLDLTWTDGEGFTVDEERDYVAEIEALLADGKWRTVAEIGNKSDHPEIPGVGAGKTRVKEVLARHADRFIERKGKEVGRHANATVYGLDSALNPDGPDTGFLGSENGRLDSGFSLGNPEATSADPNAQLGLDSVVDRDASEGADAYDGGEGQEPELVAGRTLTYLERLMADGEAP
jgi:hypothetical protein